MIYYDYGTGGAIDDRLHRVVKLKDGATELTEYSHNGTGRLVIADLLVPEWRRWETRSTPKGLCNAGHCGTPSGFKPVRNRRPRVARLRR